MFGIMMIQEMFQNVSSLSRRQAIHIRQDSLFSFIMKSDDEESRKSTLMTKQQFLETNIRQRGDVGGSAKKVGLRIKELERLYGIQNGGDRKSNDVKSKPQNSVLITQEDLAAKLGMSVDTLQNYKALADMIPELDDMVRDGKDISNFGFNWETVYQLKRSGVAVGTKTEIYNTKDKIKK